MPAWTLFVWLAIGAIAGLIAMSFIGGTPPFGKLGDMVLGIAGGVVGGYGLALLGVGGGEQPGPEATTSSLGHAAWEAEGVSDGWVVAMDAPPARPGTQAPIVVA